MIGRVVFASALLCAVLFYSGAVPPSDGFFLACAVPLDKVCAVDGEIRSNPVRSAVLGGTYRVELSVGRAFSADGLSSSASGRILVFIPEAAVESLFPGRDYTAAGESGGVLLEAGSRVSLSVSRVQSLGKYAFSVVSVSQAEVAGGGLLDSMRLLVLRFRAFCRLRFRFLMYSWGRAGGLLLALVSGAREYTDGRLSSNFRDAGLSHILALSGMHLSLFGNISERLSKRAFGRGASRAFRIFAVLLFVWFAGLSPSLFRALLCSLFPSLFLIFRLKEPKAIDSLSLSFLVHAFAFPSHVLEVAFMLSYASLFGILLLSDLFSRFLCRIFPPSASSGLSASIGAQFTTNPISLLFFGKIAPVGVVSTLFVSPLVTLFIYAGLLGILVSLFAPFLSGAFGGIMNGIYFAVDFLAGFFARFPSIGIGR